MTDIIAEPQTGTPAQPQPFTHRAYFFIRTGRFKGKVLGYWKDGGRFRPSSDDRYFALIDMLPRGGWDGRIQFVKDGDPPPLNESQGTPHRPDDENDDAEFASS